MRFSDIVFRSLAARMESIIFTKDISTSGGTRMTTSVDKPMQAKFYTHTTWCAGQPPPMQLMHPGYANCQHRCWLNLLTGMNYRVLRGGSFAERGSLQCLKLGVILKICETLMITLDMEAKANPQILASGGFCSG